MILTKTEIKNMLIGSEFLGTGGGGRLDVAKQIFRNINKPVEIVDITSVDKKDLIVTAYGVGGLKKSVNQYSVNLNNIKTLQTILQKEIKYLIAVEIGPVSVINILFLASILDLPVIDGDLVGYRSSPEIYLEGITLNKVNRLPIVVSNVNNDSMVILTTESIFKIEALLRNFSKLSLSKAYIAGYPLTALLINNYFGKGSLSYSMVIGDIIRTVNNKSDLIKALKTQEIEFLDQGKIIKQKQLKSSGFSAGYLLIKNANNIYKIIYKNEFLVLLKNNKLILTCPDSILLLDYNKNRGINNGDNNEGKLVMIFAKQSCKYWSTKKGSELFSPINLGFNYPQKLL